MWADTVSGREPVLLLAVYFGMRDRGVSGSGRRRIGLRLRDRVQRLPWAVSTRHVLLPGRNHSRVTSLRDRRIVCQHVSLPRRRIGVPAFRAELRAGQPRWAMGVSRSVVVLAVVLTACGARTQLAAQPWADAGDLHDARGVDAPSVCLDAIPGETTRYALQLEARIRRASLVVAIDRTGTMREEIDAIRASRRVLFDRLAMPFEVVRISRALVGEFRGLPYATGPQTPLELTPLSSDPSGFDVALTFDLQTGGDAPEAQVPALYAIASGDGSGANIDSVACEADEIGMACLPRETPRAIVLVTDGPFHNAPDGSAGYDPPPPGATPATYVACRDALRAGHFVVLGVATDPDAAAPLAAVALDSGAIDTDGVALVLDATPAAAANVMVDVVGRWVDHGALDVAGSAAMVGPGELSAGVEVVALSPVDGGELRSGGARDVAPGTLVELELTLRTADGALRGTASANVRLMAGDWVLDEDLLPVAIHVGAPSCVLPIGVTRR